MEEHFQKKPFVLLISPLGELDHLKYSCIVDDSRARKELKFPPQIKMSTLLKEIKELYQKESRGST